MDKVISNSSHTNLENLVMGLVVIFLLTKLQTVNSYITASWWGIDRQTDHRAEEKVKPGSGL